MNVPIAMNPKPASRLKKLLAGVAILLGIYATDSLTSMGKVIDEETGKPLDGVFVLAHWKSSGSNVIDSRTVCYAFAWTKSDKNGRFWLRSLSWNINPFYWERHRYTELYLAGYESARGDKSANDVRKMRKVKGTAEERLKELTGIGYRRDCVSENEAKEMLAPLYKAQHEEAISIALTPEEKKMAESLRGELIEAEFGAGAYSKMLMKEMNERKR